MLTENLKEGEMQPKEQVRLTSLDAIRGLTALMLVILHYTTASWSFEPPYIPLPLPYPMDELTQFMWRGLWGAVGVLIFFSLSGFVFMWYYQQKILRNEISFRMFAVYRFSRLYPLCWLSSIVMLILSLADKALGGDVIYSAYDIIKSFTVLGTYVLDAGTPTLNGVTWTLSLEVTMYCVFYIITWKSNRFKEKTVLYLLPVLVGVALLNLSNANLPVLNQYFALAILSFFMGCITCEIYKVLRVSRHKTVVGYCCLMCIFLFICSWFWPGIEYYNRTFSSLVVTHAIVVIPMLILAVLFVKPVKMLLSCKILKYLGDWSFSIYLLHWPILTGVSLLNKHGFIEFDSSNTLNLLFIILFTLIVSAISFYCFERPVQAWIRKKYHARIEVEG